LTELRSNVSLLEKGVAGKDSRLISRVLRNSYTLRKKMTAAFLRPLIEQSFPVDSAERAVVLKFLDTVPATDDSAAAMEESSSSSSSAAAAAAAVDSSSSSSSSSNGGGKKKALQSNKTSITPEVEIYLHLLVLEYIIDHGAKDEVKFPFPFPFLFVCFFKVSQ
jgi:hypothetical protein